ncbi:hypothetical protein IAE39_002681 [Pseudomonas sp. S37]|nr:hypothetical protein [Pseudomonas sp. S37]
MASENLIEICGTVVVPACVGADEGAPHMGVRIQLGTEEDKVIMAAWHCQTYGAEMPFSLLLDRNSLPEGAEPTLVASYGTGVQHDADAATLCMPLDVSHPQATSQRVLAIPALPGQPAGQGEAGRSPAIITLENTVEIPDEALRPQALLTLGLYRTQEDGHSNRGSSYIAGTALWPTQGTLTLNTYLDGNTVDPDEPLQLRVAYYDPQTMIPYAGRNLRNLTLASIAELDVITLRAPRRS